jgi:hypothetical protein
MSRLLCSGALLTPLRKRHRKSEKRERRAERLVSLGAAPSPPLRGVDEVEGACLGRSLAHHVARIGTRVERVGVARLGCEDAVGLGSFDAPRIVLGIARHALHVPPRHLPLAAADRRVGVQAAIACRARIAPCERQDALGALPVGDARAWAARLAPPPRRIGGARHQDVTFAASRSRRAGGNRQRRLAPAAAGDDEEERDDRDRRSTHRGRHPRSLGALRSSRLKKAERVAR